MPRLGVFRVGVTVCPSKIHVKLPAEDFFVVLLFLLQRGNLVDLSLYDSGWVNIEIVIRPGVGAKTALQ